MPETVTLLMYDRIPKAGDARLRKNYQLLKSVLNGHPLAFDVVDRPKNFSGYRGAVERLMDSNPLPYAGVILSDDALHAQEVLDAAELFLLMHDLPSSRIFCLAQQTPTLRSDGEITTVHARGGNGHLTEDIARRLAQTLAALRGN